MYWMNFWPSTVYEHQNILEKTLIEVGSSHLHASFGTLCVEIGELFQSLTGWLSTRKEEYFTFIYWETKILYFRLLGNQSTVLSSTMKSNHCNFVYWDIRVLYFCLLGNQSTVFLSTRKSNHCNFVYYSKNIQSRQIRTLGQPKDKTKLRSNIP